MTQSGGGSAAPAAGESPEPATAWAESNSIELHGQLTEQQDLLAEQQHHLAERDAIIADYELALRRAETDRKALQDALDHSTATIEKLRNSVSWRVTLPLRSVGKAGARLDGWVRKGAGAVRRVFSVAKGDVRLIEKSGLFDREYYLREYPEVAQSGLDPITHFLKIGAKEGKNPSPYFDTVYYAAQMDGGHAPEAQKKD